MDNHMRINTCVALLLVAGSSAVATPAHAPWPGGVGVVRIYSDEMPRATVAAKPVALVREQGTWPYYLTSV